MRNCCQIAQWICLILTVETIILISVNCEPEKGLFKYIVKVSYKECVVACDSQPRCLSATFSRLYLLCTLYSVLQEATLGPSITVYTKSSPVLAGLPEDCGTGRCLPQSCSNPRQVPGTRTLGNMVSVGSRVKYQCLDGSASEVSICLSNGSWSFVHNDICSCSTPDRHNVLQNIQLWTYQSIGVSTISAVATCTDSCTEVPGDGGVCDQRTGTWNFTSNVCCNKIVCPDSTWLQFNNSCYKLTKVKLFEEGALECELMGGHAVFIENKEENSWLKTRFVLSHNSVLEGLIGFFIGITNFNKSRHWIYKYYKTNLTANYNDFYSGEPNFPSTEHCCIMYKPFNYQWADIRCDYPLPTVCELELITLDLT